MHRLKDLRSHLRRLHCDEEHDYVVVCDHHFGCSVEHAVAVSEVDHIEAVLFAAKTVEILLLMVAVVEWDHVVVHVVVFGVDRLAVVVESDVVD